MRNQSVFSVTPTPAFAFELAGRTALCRGFIGVDEAGDLPAFHVI